MPRFKAVLVVSCLTTESRELRQALLQQAAAVPTRFTLIVPRTARGPSAGRAASQRLARALAWAHAAGLDAVGLVSDSDPLIAIADAFDPGRFDQIIIATLPIGVSRWLGVDLPARVRRLTDAPVRHVETTAAKVDSDDVRVLAPRPRPDSKPTTVSTGGTPRASPALA